jgi:hypothetical protein
MRTCSFLKGRKRGRWNISSYIGCRKRTFTKDLWGIIHAYHYTAWCGKERRGMTSFAQADGGKAKVIR